ncbi:MAG: hypothetical protein HY719_14055 [Planctomycetes bacterium]|nr:hypothetical protein [Planctomycetota bacterium]
MTNGIRPHLFQAARLALFLAVGAGCASTEVLNVDDLPPLPPPPRSAPDREFTNKEVSPPGPGLPARSVVVITRAISAPGGEQQRRTTRFWQEGGEAIVTERTLTGGVETGFCRAVVPLAGYSPLLTPPVVPAGGSEGSGGGGEGGARAEGMALSVEVKVQERHGGEWKRTFSHAMPSEPAADSPLAAWVARAREVAMSPPPRFEETRFAQLKVTTLAPGKGERGPIRAADWWVLDQGRARYQHDVTEPIAAGAGAEGEEPADVGAGTAPEGGFPPEPIFRSLGVEEFWRAMEEAAARGFFLHALPVGGEKSRAAGGAEGESRGGADNAIYYCARGAYGNEVVEVLLPLTGADPLMPDDPTARALLAWAREHRERK